MFNYFSITFQEKGMVSKPKSSSHKKHLQTCGCILSCPLCTLTKSMPLSRFWYTCAWNIASNLFSNSAAWLQKKNYTTALAAILPQHAISQTIDMPPMHHTLLKNHEKATRRRAAFFLTLSNSLSHSIFAIPSPANWLQNPFPSPATLLFTLPATCWYWRNCE